MCAAKGAACHGRNNSANQMVSCDQACQMRHELDVSEEECVSHCDRDGSSGCDLEIAGKYFELCESCYDIHTMKEDCTAACKFVAPTTVSPVTSTPVTAKPPATKPPTTEAAKNSTTATSTTNETVTSKATPEGNSTAALVNTSTNSTSSAVGDGAGDGLGSFECRTKKEQLCVSGDECFKTKLQCDGGESQPSNLPCTPFYFVGWRSSRIRLVSFEFVWFVAHVPAWGVRAVDVNKTKCEWPLSNISLL